MRYLSYIRRSPQTYFFFVCFVTKIYTYKISNVAHTVRNLLKVTNCFHQRATYVQGGTAVGRSTVLWTRREFGVRITKWTDCVDVGSHYKPCDVFRKEF